MKIALVGTLAEPFWGSVKSIRANLIEAYQGLNADVRTFFYTDDSSALLVNEIEAYQADIVVMLESFPLPMNFLKSLNPQWKIIFHLYGDFTLFTFQWKQIEDHLKGKKVKFLVSSSHQFDLINNFISEDYLGICPFPLQEKHFYPETENEKKKKKDPFIITLSGRFSTQKNSLLTCQWIADFLRISKLHAEVHIAGHFDDCGFPLWGFSEPVGFQFYCYQQFHSSLEKELQKKFIHHGFLNAEELRTFYSKSDLHISLSTYHDEDFGMAPLEAFMCGSRGLLTRWGGFTGFALENNTFIPVEINDKGLKIHKSIFKQELNRLTKEKVSYDERFKRYLLYSMHFGVRSITHVIETEIKSTWHSFKFFKKFLTFHSSLSEQYQKRAKPLYESASNKDTYYRKLYETYIR